MCARGRERERERGGTGRVGGWGVERTDGLVLVAVGREPRRRLLLRTPADLSDHDDPLSNAQNSEAIALKLQRGDEATLVCGSFVKRSSTSMKLVPLNGSPPMPTQVDWPSPTAVVW